MTEEFVKKKGYKLVQPDGGYGYVVVGAASMNFIAGTMFAVCYGMIFNDFFGKMKMGATAISLLTGINALSIAVSGFLTGPLLKTMSRRKLALVGSTFFNAGVFGTVFANTQWQLIVCQGLLQSFGFGFLFNVSCTVMNDYFLKKRLLFLTFSQTISALASMVAPMVASWSLAEYGFRGTLVVISAISLQTFVASSLMQPVAWHMKKEVVDDVQEKKLLLQMEKSVNDQSKTLQTPIVKINDMEKVEDLFTEKKDITNPSSANLVIARIKDFLDWPLLKKFGLTCGCFGAPVAIFADVTYVYFIAQYLYDLKWGNDQVKWALALIGFGDMAARIVIIFSSSWLNRLGSHTIYVAGLFIAVATKLGVLWVSDHTWTLAILTIMGVSRCTIAVLYPLVVSDSVEPEQFPSAMGISLMTFGIISIVMGPVVGAIRDATGEYTAMFLILTAFLMTTAVVWIVELRRGRQKIPSCRDDEIN